MKVVPTSPKPIYTAQVLFEWDGVRRDTAPRREARQVAPTIPARSTAGGGLGTDFDCDGGTICVATGQAGAEIGAEIGADMAPTLNCNHEAPYVARTLLGKSNCSHAEDKETYVCFDTTQITSAANYSNPKPGDPCHPLASRAHAPAIAFPANLSGTQCASAVDVAPSMGAANPTAVAYGIRTANTSSNGWGIQEECTHTLDCAQGVAVAQPVAFHPTQDPISSTDGSTHALGCGSTGGQASVAVAFAATGQAGAGWAPPSFPVQEECSQTLDTRRAQSVMTAMQVRRLTPTEAEKLQGFEPGYTAIPWRGKPASECPDGPRYRALGNSWAIPCVSWIGERIQRHLAGEL